MLDLREILAHNKITMDERFQQLKNRYRTNREIADKLGVSRRTYLNYRKLEGELPLRVSLLLDWALNGNGNNSKPLPVTGTGSSTATAESDC